MADPRSNPFRTSRIESLAFRAAGGRSQDQFARELIARWRDLGRRGALVGPHGHGKTTLLEALVRRLEDDGVQVTRLRLRREGSRIVSDPVSRPAEAAADQTLTIDGLDLLRPWTWWRVRHAWRHHGILATSHRRGRLPTLHEHRTSPDLLRQLVGELLEDDDFRRVEGGLDELFARHDGNVRECLRELYDVFGAGS